MQQSREFELKTESLVKEFSRKKEITKKETLVPAGKS